MTVYAVRRHDSLMPAYLAAVALHLAVFLIFTLWLKPAPMLPLGSSVPINIVSSDTLTDTRPAEQAPQTQTATTETPAPAEKTPIPESAWPPAAAPAKATPAPAESKPAPAPSPAKPAKKAFSLDALEASIAKAARAAPSRQANAARGPSRAETAPQPRPDAGVGVSQSQLEGLQQLLGRLWNPNCQVDGGDEVKLKTTFTVGTDGHLIGPVSAGGAERSGDAVVFAAARRAIDAVHQVEPFAEPFRGQRILVNFDAHEVCASR